MTLLCLLTLILHYTPLLYSLKGFWWKHRQVHSCQSCSWLTNHRSICENSPRKLVFTYFHESRVFWLQGRWVYQLIKENGWGVMRVTTECEMFSRALSLKDNCTRSVFIWKTDPLCKSPSIWWRRPWLNYPTTGTKIRARNNWPYAILVLHKLFCRF